MHGYKLHVGHLALILLAIACLACGVFIWGSGSTNSLVQSLSSVIHVNSAIGDPLATPTQSVPGDEQPYVGLTYLPVTPQLAQQEHLAVDAGVWVSDVVADSPAAQAGLQNGDVIVAVNGQAVQDATLLTATLLGGAPGDTIHITCLRHGELHEFDLRVGSRPRRGR